MYLDNNASTATDPEIVDVLHRVTSSTSVANPHSSEHAYGWRADDLIQESKEIVADFLNSLPEEIYFTSGATESNNLAIIGLAMSAHDKKVRRNEIIVSPTEHKCVLNSANFVTHIFNEFKIIEAPINKNGIVDIQKLERLISDKTLLVSIMAVNNEIGVIQPLKEIGTLCKKQGAIFHTDAAQGAYIDLDVVENNIDMLSLSGHKVYAPKGIGVLYVNDDISTRPSPIIYGGNQQNGLRSGTLSPALCISMAKALEKISKKRVDESVHLSKMREIFLQTLKGNNIDYVINGCMKNRHPGNLNIQITGIDSSTLITRLQPNLAISTGSACNSGAVQGSYVLKEIGLSTKAIESSIRIGFGRFNTMDESVRAAKMISDEINRLKTV